MTRIGVLGGSFDPIHNGHLVAAAEVAKKLQLSKVIFVPAGQQWQKSSQTSATDRLEMVRLAVADNPVFDVSTVDIDREGPTYTVDTLRDLKVSNPESELIFIGGADAISGLDSWKSAERLGELAHFVAVTRPGFEFRFPQVANGNIETMEIPALDISSTEVRKRIADGLNLEGLVPEAVLSYIQTHNLYQD
jgi:nicotinate-nucleotide adenylyltransferase